MVKSFDLLKQHGTSIDVPLSHLRSKGKASAYILLQCLKNKTIFKQGIGIAKKAKKQEGIAVVVM